MKTRQGFISNSSSTAFILTNLSDETLTIVDFTIENRKLVDAYKQYYNDNEVSLGEVIDSAEKRLQEDPQHYTFEPHQQRRCVFGDEQGDFIGRVYDYILREGGTSKNWKWAVYESLR